MKQTALIFTVLQLVIIQSFGQVKFERNYDVLVKNQNDTLSRAWEGGINNIFVNECSFDNNPEKDLFIFDKANQKTFLLLNQERVYQPINLNISIKKWLLLRDFNCDGELDIFTGTTGGIRVYKNTGNWEFSLEYLTLQTELPSGHTNLYVANTDVPAIEDIDGDGDLDILAFNINGEFVDYHRNLAIENTGDCGLDMKLNDNCWGRFKEDALDSQIKLNQSCSAVESNRSGGVHAGSTITAVDFNKNNIWDILIGDISSNNMIHLNNGGTSLIANITEVDSLFPKYNTPANINIFPYASYVDVNNDNKKDLIITSTDDLGGDNKSVLFYKNIGMTMDTVSFESSVFLIDEMIDIGSNSMPVPCDENQDGLTDFILGTSGETINGSTAGKLMLFRNIGSINTPKFELVNSDYLEFSLSSEYFLSPAIGDIDQDGDDDLIIGLENGKLLYYNNIAGNGNNYDFLLADANFEGIDVGSRAIPQLAYIDADDKLDLLIGAGDGTITYFPNEEQSANGFDYSLEFPDFGNINMQDFNNGYFFGNAAPWFANIDGTDYLFVGGESGKIELYEVDVQNPTSTFNKLNSDYDNIFNGTNAVPRIVELGNNLSYPELILGNRSGGLAFYFGAPPGNSTNNSQNKIEYIIAKNQIELESNFEHLRLYDVQGKVVASSSGKAIPLPPSNGVYILWASSQNSIKTNTVVLIR